MDEAVEIAQKTVKNLLRNTNINDLMSKMSQQIAKNEHLNAENKENSEKIVKNQQFLMHKFLTIQKIIGNADVSAAAAAGIGVPSSFGPTRRRKRMQCVERLQNWAQNQQENRLAWSAGLCGFLLAVSMLFLVYIIFLALRFHVYDAKFGILLTFLCYVLFFGVSAGATVFICKSTVAAYHQQNQQPLQAQQPQQQGP